MRSIVVFFKVFINNYVSHKHFLVSTLPNFFKSDNNKMNLINSKDVMTKIQITNKYSAHFSTVNRFTSGLIILERIYTNAHIFSKMPNTD